MAAYFPPPADDPAIDAAPTYFPPPADDPIKELPGSDLTAAEPESTGSYLSGLVGAVKQGIPFSDEVSGLGYALGGSTQRALGSLFGADSVPENRRNGSFWGDYEQGKNAELLPAQAFKQEHPLLGTAAELAGSALLPVPEMKATSILGGAAKGAATGGGFGALFGLGSGEGLEERGTNALKGLGAGALLGLLPGAIAGRANGVTEGAEARAAVADALNPSVGPQQAVDDASEIASAIYQKAKDERSAIATPLFDVAKNVPTPTRVVTEPVASAILDANGNPYMSSVTKEVPDVSDELLQYLSTGPARKAMADARDLNPALRDLPDTHPEMIQYALQGLGASIGNEARNPTGMGNLLYDTKRGLENEVAQFNPQLLEARNAYKDMSQRVNMLDDSQIDFLRKLDTDQAQSAIRGLFTKFTPERVAQIRNEFVTAGGEDKWHELVKTAIQSKAGSRPLQKLIADPKVAPQIEAALGPDKWDTVSQIATLSDNAPGSATIGAILDMTLPGSFGATKTIAKLLGVGEETVAKYLSRTGATPEKALGVFAGASQEDKVPNVQNAIPQLISAKRLASQGLADTMASNLVNSYANSGATPMSIIPKDSPAPISVADPNEPVLDGIPLSTLLDGIRQVESGGGKYLKSPAGALGPYQFMPATAKDLGLKDPMDEAASRAAASKYILQLYKQTGNLEDALAAYNFGIGNVLKGRARPKETQEYPGKVLAAIAALNGLGEA